MKERPILFSAPMVQAIKRKRQTRRIVKFPCPRDSRCEANQDDWIITPVCSAGLTVPDALHITRRDGIVFGTQSGKLSSADQDKILTCPYGKPGDRLWVKETFSKSPNGIIYRATQHEHGITECDDFIKPWTPSIFMPRWASRYLLEITGVRVERVQDISEADAKAEGCEGWVPCGVWTGLRGVRVGGGALRQATCREEYEWLWGKINGTDSWATNPYVWVVEFREIA